MPLILIATIVVSILAHSFIPYEAKSFIYALSLTAKSMVLFILPFVIFGLLFKTFARLRDQAASVFFLIFGGLCASNFFNASAAGYVGSLLYNLNLNLAPIPDVSVPLEPYFTFLIPSVVKNEFALFGGIAAGLIAAAYNKKLAFLIAEKTDFILNKLFSIISLLIPPFIMGFVLKCASDGNLEFIIKNYSQILLIFFAYALFYIAALYLIVNKFSIRETLLCVKNMLPAWLVAFSSASSALAMPVTILSAQKNAKNKELAGSVISITANIHLIGDCLFIPTIAYAILKNYGIEEPSLITYLAFAVFFVIAKFSVAAVPAGGIIVMVPILEKYLSFSPDMSTLIIAIYAIFDPIITGFNVLGNGAFAKLIDNIKGKMR
ncbi:MAG: cation:dicarboxylase symporter family transporter [Holosporaceae bacterium]|jgi:Na+/H+-dicarboxylate symporter|nr:cation:dicarboxylase symporter family transporter [Holosporaceae bacterium]